MIRSARWNFLRRTRIPGMLREMGRIPAKVPRARISLWGTAVAEVLKMAVMRILRMAVAPILQWRILEIAATPILQIPILRIISMTW